MKINKKTLLYCCVYIIPFISFSQEFESSKTSVEDIDLIIEEGTYESNTSSSVDKLVLTNTVNFDENEWSLIKAQIVQNRERMIQTKEIFTTKTIDTVYVKLPVQNKPTRISSW